MSRMEYRHGVLELVKTNGTAMEFVIEKCDDLGIKTFDCFHEMLYLIEAKSGIKYIDLRGKLYIDHGDELDELGFAKVTSLGDGRFSYTVGWYNGGASFSEAIETAVEECDD